MPDPAQVLAAKFEGAVAGIDEWLRELLGGIERLTPDALSAYPRHAPAAGWRVTVEFGGQTRRMDIIVGSAFPFRAAQIALVDRPQFLTWPHVERDGVLCLVPEQTTFSPDDPVGGVANLLDEARKLVERVTTENVEKEFRAEVLSYWSNQSTYSGPSLLGLIDPVGPSRPIRTWMGKDAVVLADDDASVHEWLRHRFGNLPKRSLKTVPGVLLNLPEPLLPSEYPETASDVYALAERLDAVPLMEAAASALPGQIPIALTMPTPHGPAVAGIVVTRPPRARGSDPLFRGFRPNGIRKEMVTRRYFATHPAIKAQVERIDPPWIHGRNQDSRFQTLRKSTVAVLGCGSIGEVEHRGHNTSPPLDL